MEINIHYRAVVGSILTLFFSQLALAFGMFEPSIECTVIKVYSTTKAFGFDKFPKLYQSINNDPLSSKLIIAGKEFSKLSPISIIKTETYEKISISSEQDQLSLELSGKPISRNGTMMFNGVKVASVTCH
jgi:hypothetical protein